MSTFWSPERPLPFCCLCLEYLVRDTHLYACPTCQPQLPPVTQHTASLAIPAPRLPSPMPAWHPTPWLGEVTP